jgi:hypothetical protein
MTEVVIVKRELRRPYNFETLTDIVPGETPRLPKLPNGDLVITFNAVLTAEQVAAIRLRMTTADDAEAATRTLLTTAVQDAAAYVPPTLPPGATAEESAAVIADLTVQLTAVTSTLASAVDYLLGTTNNP